MNIDRRNFLKTGLEASVLAASGLLVGCSRDKPKNRAPEKQKTPDIQWAFLEDPEIPVDMRGDVKSVGILFDEQQIDEKSSRFQEVAPEAIPQIKDALRQNDIQGSSTIKAFVRSYAVPSVGAKCESLIKYCEKAKDFLDSKIKGLNTPEFSFKPLSQAPQLSEAYAIRNYYEVVAMDVYNNGAKVMSTGKPYFHTGGLAKTQYKGELWSGNLEWKLFVTEGHRAITSAFSELIPLTTLKTSIPAYYPDADKYIEADETVAESLSYLLALQIAGELSIPNGEALVKKTLENMPDQRYRFVPLAIKWTKQNGIQNAFDLYMENPQKFIEEIKK